MLNKTSSLTNWKYKKNIPISQGNFDNKKDC